MSDIAILKSMFKEEATEILEDHNGKKKVTLKELDLPVYSVTIYGMPNDDEVIILKADKFISPNKIFKSSKGECKRADFVIIAERGNKKVILCIEMKSKKGSLESEIIQQLKGATCFVAYCQEIGRLFWNQKDFLKNYEYRFISIRDITVPKKPTRTSPTDIHDRPEKMLKINSPKYITFDSLI